MSARVESAPVRRFNMGTIVLAVVAALSVGVSAGVIVTRAGQERPAASSTAVGAQLWDAGKLEAMEGRVLAERFRAEPQAGWDEGKLEAMEGRVLFDAQGAEDPVTKPHGLKRPPAG